MVQEIGLKQRIMAATSVEEVEKLLREGDCYLNATEKTKKKWKTVSEKRIAQLRKK
jgi:hypothetical protein